MAAKIKEGMTGGQVADIIEQNFENLEDKFQLLSDLFDHTKEDLQRTLDEYQELVDDAYGSLVTKTDEEDTTTDLGKIKFKDRAYDPDNFSGKGYKILRKNIVCDTETKEAKNILTQDMINEPNTVYEIRYDFDLNGETINIPEGCTLKFEGGSFRNGDVVGNNTEITSLYIKKIFDKINLNTSFISTTIYPEYFGALANGIAECSSAINLASEFCRNIKGNLKFTQGVYLVSDTLILGAINVDGNGAIIKSSNIVGKPIISIDPRFGLEWSSFSERTRFIKNLRIDCNSEDNIGLQVYGDGQTFSNIHIREVGWVGFYAYDSGNAILTNFLIEGSNKSLDESVGLALEAPDWQISNGIVQNVSTGVITASNFFTNMHTWGYSTRKYMITHLLVYQGKCSISDWYFDTVNCRSDDNVEHSLHPDWLYLDNEDIKRRKYIGNAAIMCLDRSSINCTNVRCFLASEQSLGDIKPIFLFNSDNSINNIVNVEVPDNWIKYHYNSTSTYVENTNADTVINLSDTSTNTLIKLCNVEQINEYNSIVFNILTSCNGLIINSIVSVYNDDTTHIVNSMIMHNTTVDNYDNKYTENVYIKNNYVYYNLVTAFNFVKSITISYVNKNKNIIPTLSTDDLTSATKIENTYIPAYTFDKIPLVAKNTEVKCLTCVGNNNTIKLGNITNITKYHTLVYNIDIPLNNYLVKLTACLYNGDTPSFNVCLYGTYETFDIFPVKAYLYNNCAYINITTLSSYVKDIIISYYNLVDAQPEIEEVELEIEELYEIDTYKLLYTNGITKQMIIGNTVQRPTDIKIGFQYFDTTLNKPIWWTGTKWVDATGADV